MIKLKNDYAIVSNSGAFTLVKLGIGKNKDGNEVETQKPIAYHVTLAMLCKATLIIEWQI